MKITLLQYILAFLLIIGSTLIFWRSENISLPALATETGLRTSGVVKNIERVENYRQSGVECSSFSLYAASTILETDIGTPQEVWDSLGPKFSFGILPTTFQRFIKKYFDASLVEKNLDGIRSAIIQGRVVILLVEHQGYQHYFTVVGFDLDKDERYIYDSLAPRVDVTYTVDLNEDNPGNYTLSTEDLLNKRERGGKYGLWKMWGAALNKKELVQ